MDYSKTPLPLIEGKCPPVSMWMNGEFVYYYPEPDKDYQDPEIREEEKIIEGLEQFRSDLKPFCGSHADWKRFDAGLALLKEYKPKTGKWIPCKASIYPYGYDVKCSECGLQMGSTFGYHYCPKCGAKMEE